MCWGKCLSQGGTDLTYLEGLRPDNTPSSPTQNSFGRPRDESPVLISAGRRDLEVFTYVFCSLFTVSFLVMSGAFGKLCSRPLTPKQQEGCNTERPPPLTYVVVGEGRLLAHRNPVAVDCFWGLLAVCLLLLGQGNRLGSGGIRLPD